MLLLSYPRKSIAARPTYVEILASETAEQMEHKEDGRFSISLSLKSNQNYQFRYRLDGERWENDTNADALIPNAFGSDNSVLQL